MPRRDHLVLLSRQEEQGHLDVSDAVHRLPLQPQDSVLQGLEREDGEESVHDRADRDEGVLQDDAARLRVRLAALLQRPRERHRHGAAERPAEDEDPLRVDAPGLRSGLQPLPGADGVLDEPLLGRSAIAVAVPPVVERKDVCVQLLDDLRIVWHSETDVPCVGVAEEERRRRRGVLIGRDEPPVDAHAVSGLENHVLIREATVRWAPQALGVVAGLLHARQHTRHVEHGLLPHDEVHDEEDPHAE
mmetsp:Transcript_61696/g.198791  ORF Transcript_61696/g.198791 Transcript_61696/m.198791 type:complete len:246 (+) Transcript_61696:319-1056(+)